MNDINYRLKITSNSDAEYLLQLPLADVKAHLRVSWTSEDSYITTLIRSAYNIAEGYTNLSLIPKTHEMFLDRFPNSYDGSKEDEWLDLVNSCGGLSITTIKYYDADNVYTTWNSSNYNVDEPGITWGRVYPKVDKVFPSTADRPQAVEVKYDTGFDNATAGDVLPDAIRAAILILIGNLYENRQDNIVGRIASELPMTAKVLLAPYRMVLT